MNPPTPPLYEDQKLQLCLERDRLLCDPEFARSPVMCKLLKYLVDHRLADNRLPLKAYTIAVEALGREESFDPDLHSYPRVQIGKLRKMLEHFYQREGGEYRLTIPLYYYSLMLEPNITKANKSDGTDPGQLIGIEKTQTTEVPQSALMSSQISKKWTNWSSLKIGVIASTLVILLLSGGIYAMNFSNPTPEIIYPTIFVKRASSVSNPATQAAEKSTIAYLVNAISKFDQLQVSNTEPAHKDSPLYILDYLVVDATGRTIQFLLVDDITKQVIWSDTIILAANEHLNDRLAKIVVAIAAPYGAVERAELSKHRNDFTLGYPCILQFHQFARYRNLSDVSPLHNCLSKSVIVYPNNVHLLSLLAIFKSVTQHFNVNSAVDTTAMEFARRAARLDSNSSSANFAVALVAFLEGDCETGVAWGKRAIELNPLNPRFSGYLGLYMIGCNLPEGEKYASQALEIDPNTDLAVAATLAFQKLKRGDALAAQQLSQKYMVGFLPIEPGLELTYVLSTATLGNKPEARKAWKKLAARFGYSDHTPVRQVLSAWVANPKLINEIVLIFDEIDLYE